MSTSVTSTVTPTVPTVITTPTAANTGAPTGAPAGADTASTLNSAAPVPAEEPSLGFCGTISNWISNLCGGIRSCLSCLPFIGSWFKKEELVTDPTAPAAPAPAPEAPLVDHEAADLLQMRALTSAFFPAFPGGLVPPALTITRHDNALESFRAILSPLYKMEALNLIANSAQPTPEAATALIKEFSESLPPNILDRLKGHIWFKNGNSDIPPTGVGALPAGRQFGDYMIAEHSGHLLVRAAIASYLNELRYTTRAPTTPIQPTAPSAT
jgi:hypothetical protein